MDAFKIPEDKIFVSYLSSEDIYKPLDKKLSKKIIEKEYSITGEYILYVGGFSPRKNILGIIDAFSKLITSYKRDIKLVIAGKKGKSYSIYKERCNKDRKSTRLNSSHANISYAVFCLKKK